MAALIKGDELRERLQELLRQTSGEDDNGQAGGKKRLTAEDGQLSYTDSFDRNH